MSGSGVTRVAAGCAVLASLVAAGCEPPATEGWRSQLVSVSAAGGETGNWDSGQPVFSPDGTQLAFVSGATNLGPPDTGISDDVFVRDLATGEITMVSANAAGTSGGNGDSQHPVFSPDGTQLLFESLAPDLGPTDANAASDVFLHDLTTGTTSLVSARAATPSATGDGASTNASFSPDGTRVVFESGASDLGPSDPNGWYGDIYLRDLAAGTTSLVSVNFAGTSSGTGISSDPVFDAAGTQIAFESSSMDLDPDPAHGNGQYGQIHVRDLVAGTTEMVSLDDAGGAHTGGADQPAISPDGTLVAFATSSELDPADTDSDRDIFLRDLADGSTTLVSDVGSYHADGPVFDASGTRLAFATMGGDGGAHVKDLDTGVTTTLSENTSGATTSGENPVFSPDGTQVLFASRDPEMGTVDHSISMDLFLHDLTGGTTQLVSGNARHDDGGNDDSARQPGGAAFSPDGNRIAYETRASNLGSTDSNGWGLDLYVATFENFGETDLALTFTADADEVQVGDELTYELTVTNDGPQPAEHVRLGHQLPWGVETATVVVDPAGPECDEPYFGYGYGCELGTLEPGETVSVTATIVVPDTGQPTLDSVASLAMGPTVESDPADNSASLDTPVVAPTP